MYVYFWFSIAMTFKIWFNKKIVLLFKWDRKLTMTYNICIKFLQILHNINILNLFYVKSEQPSIVHIRAGVAKPKIPATKSFGGPGSSIPLQTCRMYSLDVQHRTMPFIVAESFISFSCRSRHKTRIILCSFQRAGPVPVPFPLLHCISPYRTTLIRRIQFEYICIQIFVTCIPTYGRSVGRSGDRSLFDVHLYSPPSTSNYYTCGGCLCHAIAFNPIPSRCSR